MNLISVPLRLAVAFLISLALNSVVLTVDFWIDPRQAELSTSQRFVIWLLRPAEMLTNRLTPGHGGLQILALAMFSVLIYTFGAWVALSVPVWWRRRM